MQSIEDARRRQTSTRPRVPPHDLQAEESLLGAMLLSKDAVADALEVVSAEDFYKPAHGHVFSAIVTVYGRGHAIDPVTVADELRRTGLLDAVGGQHTLASLQANTPAISGAPRYAGIVDELATLRRLIGAGGEIAELGYEAGTDVPASVDKAETLVFDVANRRARDSRRPAAELVPRALDRIEALQERGDEIIGLPTGFLDLDRMLAGLHPGNLVIVGARPAMGKSAFAVNVASHVAVHCGEPALVFSLEMSTDELMQRVLSAEARVDSMHMRTGRVSDDEWLKINTAAGRVAPAPLYIDELADSSTTSVMDLRARARRQKSRHGLSLVIVDYLQLMTGRKGAENRQVEIAEISRGLKLMARDLEVPVIALSQLSRNLETRADKRPMLSDLRESGSQEQDADVVMFIYRDEVYNEHSPDRGMAEIIVAKHRHGPTGTAKLAFMARYNRFANMATNGAEPPRHHQGTLAG